MKRKSDEGQVLLSTALGLTVLLGFLGLGIDLGVLRYQKRLAQSAADAAAIAGASNLSYGGVTSGAQNASAANGFTDNGSGLVSNCGAGAAIGTICVQVLNPPADVTVNGVTIAGGPHTGNANYVEVVVAAVERTYFMPVLGITQSTITARAVGTNVSGGNNSGCLYTLDPNTAGIEGININGVARLLAPNCGIVDNGNLNTQGGAYTVTANNVSVSGDFVGSHNDVTCNAQPSDCPATGAPAGASPINPSPPAVGCAPIPCGSSVTLNAGGALGPGTYSSISVQGNGNVTFSPGIYVIDGSGGLSCNGTPTLIGTGVMFYFTGQATVNCQGNDTLQLTAPSSANCPACPSQYDGILMYQDPSDTNMAKNNSFNGATGPQLGGNTGSFMDGALYFPADQLTFYGNNQSFDVAMVVAGSVALSGNPTVNLTGSAGLPPGVNLVANAVLVE